MIYPELSEVLFERGRGVSSNRSRRDLPAQSVGTEKFLQSFMDCQGQGVWLLGGDRGGPVLSVFPRPFGWEAPIYVHLKICLYLLKKK